MIHLEPHLECASIGSFSISSICFWDFFMVYLYKIYIQIKHYLASWMMIQTNWYISTTLYNVNCTFKKARMCSVSKRAVLLNVHQKKTNYWYFILRHCVFIESNRIPLYLFLIILNFIWTVLKIFRPKSFQRNCLFEFLNQF